MASNPLAVDEMKSKVVPIGTSSTELLAAVADGYTVISSLQIGNVDGTNAATVDLSINKNAGGDVTFLKSLNVAAGESQVIFSYNSGRLVLEDNGTPDTLDATAGTANDLVAIINYVERT